MNTIGLELHKRESQLCILARWHGRRAAHRHEPGALHHGARRSAARARAPRGEHRERMGGRHLERLGHIVLMADPNFAPMYATPTRRVKRTSATHARLLKRARSGRTDRRTGCPRRAGVCARNSPCAKRCPLLPLHLHNFSDLRSR